MIYLLTRLFYNISYCILGQKNNHFCIQIYCSKCTLYPSQPSVFIVCIYKVVHCITLTQITP